MMFSDHSRESGKSGRPFRSWIRAAIGLGGLSVILYWVYREGSLLQQLNIWALVWATLIVLLINIVNAALQRDIARMYHCEMSLRLAMYIVALGALGNATGGLPIGTTLRYAMLRQRVGLTMGQITFGLVSVTFAVSMSLLLISAISVLALDYPMVMKILPGLLFVCGIFVIMFLLRWSRTRHVLFNLVNPLTIDGRMTKLALFCFLLALLFVTNYVIVGYFLLPGRPVPSVVFMSASALLLSIASFLQSIGGVQEFAMGFIAYLTGARLIEGVQLALIIRLAAIISSGLTLAWFLVIPGQIDAKFEKTDVQNNPT